MKNRNGRSLEVAARIRQLVDQHSLRGVARRTGVPASNVHRYINGASVPTEFCRSLIGELGVNPAWLLTGEGMPYLSDVAERTGQFAASLLDVVNGLNAVSQLRIGTLGGKQHAKTLKDLGDAMARHESLHKKLDQYSAPLLRDVLKHLRSTLDSQEMNQRYIFDKSRLSFARNLSRIAEQLVRMCSDPVLIFDQQILQGRLAVHEGDTSRAMQCSQHAILLASGRGGFTEESALATLMDTVDALHHERRFHVARRIAETALAAATPNIRVSPAGLRLEAFIADIQTNTGEVQDGLKLLMRVRGSLTGVAREEAEAYTVTALLYCNLIGIREAVELRPHNLNQATRILGAALLAETVEALDAAVAYISKGPDVSSWINYYAMNLLACLRGKEKESMPHLRRLLKLSPAPKATPPVVGSFSYYHYNVQTAICGAQVNRVLGKTVAARQHLRKTYAAIADLPDWYTLTVTLQGLHMRNALELGDRRQRQYARAWFKRHVDRGYHCFASHAN